MTWVICGSCYTLITAEENAVECPRCKGALNPTSHQRLRKFIDNGTDPTSKGIRLQDAQKAATEVLGKLEEYERFFSWLSSIETTYATGTGCSEFLASLKERANIVREGLNA